MESQGIEDSQDHAQRYEKLVLEHSSWLYRYAYWLSGSKYDADDLVQETCLRAWRFLGSLKEDAAAKSWLTTILRRENARKFERKQLEFKDVELDEIADSKEAIDARPETTALRVALANLPLKYREPLILKVLGGYSLKEISKLFGIPTATVASRLHRAKLKLRQQLEGAEYVLEYL